MFYFTSRHAVLYLSSNTNNTYLHIFKLSNLCVKKMIDYAEGTQGNIYMLAAGKKKKKLFQRQTIQSMSRLGA